MVFRSNINENEICHFKKMSSKINILWKSTKIRIKYRMKYKRPNNFFRGLGAFEVVVNYYYYKFIPW